MTSLNPFNSQSAAARVVRSVREPSRRCTGLKTRVAAVAVTLALVGVYVSIGMASPASAQPESNAHSWVVWPSGAVAFPTGRFGEKDETASAPKDGNKTGFGVGVDLGRFVSDFACIGVGFAMNRFDLDVANTPGFEHTGHTSVWSAQAWGRFFLRGGYAHWQPYLLLGAGIGKPTGKAEFDPPAYFGSPVNSEVNQLESEVSLTTSVTAGVGFLIPASPRLAVSLEPRFTTVHSKGTARTDLFTQTDGQTFEVKSDDDGNRLKAKSNTNWWELRFGVVFMLR
jgi:opacity protein-like surface antigen